MKLQIPLRVYSRDGALIGEFGEKRRTPVAFEDVPPLFIKAILAAEDDGFYRHRGVDIQGLIRAAGQLVATGRIQTGGSTITMQVAKNYFLSHERTFSRKFNEILLALQIERELEKDQILELYLNKIFLGNRAYGVEAAAQVYYGQSIGELTLPQLAMIAGLPKAPSSYNPLVNPQRALERRNWILGRMLHLDFIDEATYQQAIATPVSADYYGPKLQLQAGYVSEMARQQVVDTFGIEAYTEGYQVYTTVDANLQRTANKAVRQGLLRYDARHGYRGPEQQLPPDDSEDYSAWRAVLEQTPVVAELQPAVVTDVGEKDFKALIPNGQIVTVEWDDGLKDMRPYVDVNRLGLYPKTASDIVAVGDLVRLHLAPLGIWQLRQVPEAQAALVSLDATDGAILSLVGGMDYHQSKFNRVTQAARQPGSNFKPFIYTAALENGFTAASIINDAPIVFDDAQLESVWRPTNASGQFFGPTRLRRALFKSRNLVSIRLLRSLGINRAIDYVARFGFDPQKLPRDLSLALGSHSLTPMEIVTGYAVFANGGYRVEPYLIERVADLNDETLFEQRPVTVCRECEAEAAQARDTEDQQVATDQTANPEAPTGAGEDGEKAPPETGDGTELSAFEEATIEELLATEPEPPLPAAERVVEPRAAYIINSMLRDVVKKGTGRKARALGRDDLAGKTGTTNGPTDAWFSGYGGGVVTTTWLGFDQNQLLGRREYGGSAALPIWIDFMREALKGRPETQFKQPDGIVAVRIDPATGLRAQPGQQDAIFELFRQELAPTETVAEQADSGAMEDPDAIDREDIF